MSDGKWASWKCTVDMPPEFIATLKSLSEHKGVFQITEKRVIKRLTLEIKNFDVLTEEAPNLITANGVSKITQLNEEYYKNRLIKKVVLRNGK